MDGQGSVLFLVSHRDFPKPRDIYQLKVSFHITIEQFMSAFAHTLSPLPHPSKKNSNISTVKTLITVAATRLRKLEGSHLTGAGNLIGIMLIKPFV